MELSWYGLSCFRMTERGQATVVTDPYHSAVGIDLPSIKADVVTISHDAEGHNNSDGIIDCRHVLTGPGEYEIGGVFVTGIATHDEDGNRNVHYVYRYNNVSIAHLGDLTKVPTQTQLEALGTINILLLPVGNGKSLNASQASEVVSMLSPTYVVPMHYQTEGVTLELDPIDRFVKELGATEVEPTTQLKVTSAASSETTEVVILVPKTA